MSETVSQALVIILPIGALVLSLHFFQWRQNVAIENRLRHDIRDSEGRSRNEIKAVEERLTGEIEAVEEHLTGEIKAVEERLTGEIKAVEERLTGEIESVEERLTRRIDRTDDKVDTLIGEVGLVKGAVLGISAETASRESVTTS